MTSEERTQGTRGTQLRLTIAPDPKQSGTVRQALLAFAQDQGVEPGEVVDFVTAVGEALANAIEHAQTGEPIVVAAWTLDGCLFASVSDHGVGFVPPRAQTTALPDTYAERGRGLAIMRRYADVFRVHSVPGEGTRVTLGCQIRPPDDALGCTR